MIAGFCPTVDAFCPTVCCHHRSRAVSRNRTMKKIFSLTAAALLILGSSSCVVHTTAKKDNGKHKGWYKNRHNPHHPNSNNPGHSKQKSKNKNKLIELYFG